MRDKKFKMSFKKGLLIYAVVALLLLFIGLTFFWRFIGNYEESMPVHGMEKVIKYFKNADITQLMTENDDNIINEFEGNSSDKNIIAEKYNEYLKNKKIDFKKANNYTDKKPVYVVTADDVKVANVRLISKKKNSSNFKIWEFGSIDISDFYKNIFKTTDIKIQVPKGTEVTINGKTAAESYITKTEQIEELKPLLEYVANLPDMVTYEIKGFTTEPEVKAVLNGEELKLTSEKNTYTGTFTATEEFISEVNEYVDKVVVAYAKNFINVEKKILPYIMKNSELYASVKSATTAWYPDSEIKSYDFAEKEISNYQVYSEDCFSCDVKYTIDISFRPSYKVEDPTETGNFKWFFTKKDGTWYLTSMQYN